MSDEIWLPVAGWEKFYEVSNIGNVRCIKENGKHIKFGTHLSKMPNCGYLVVSLSALGVTKRLYVHRLVLMTFVGMPTGRQEACHGNGDRTDNRLENLRWDSRKSNHADKKRHGTWQGGEACGTSKLTESAVIDIRTSGNPSEDLAEKYGVSLTCIIDARKGKTWAHVDRAIFKPKRRWHKRPSTF